MHTKVMDRLFLQQRIDSSSPLCVLLTKNVIKMASNEISSEVTKREETAVFILVEAIIFEGFQSSVL